MFKYHLISFSQARIIAFDTARPSASAVATVNIFVIRNPNAPQFRLPSYSTTINENQAIGQFIINVTATDADVQVSHSFKLETALVNELNKANQYEITIYDTFVYHIFRI